MAQLNEAASTPVVTPQETPVASAHSTQETTTQEQASRDIVSLLAKNGFDLSEDYTDADYFRELESLQSQVDEFERLRPEIEEFTKLKDDFLQWRAAQSQGAGASPSAANTQTAPAQPVVQSTVNETELEGFSPPPVDPAAQRMVAQAIRDGAVKLNPVTGLYETESAVYRNAVDQLNAVETYKQNFYAEFAKDPASIITRAAKPVLNQYEAKIQSLEQQIQEIRQSERMEVAEQILHQNMSRMVEMGPDGQPVVENGQYKPTAFYRAYQAAAQHFSGFIADPVELTQKALEVASQVIPPQETKPADAGTTPRDRQGRFLRRVQGQTPEKATDQIPETKPGNPAVAPASTPMSRYDELIKEYLANNR